MNRTEFLRALEREMEIAEGSLHEGQPLSQVDGWDSMTAVIFIALADERLGVTVSGNEVAQSKTLSDLLSLLGDRVHA